MNKKSFTLKELADRFNVEYNGNPDHIVSGVNDLINATKKDISFLSNKKYSSQLFKTQAGIVCVDKSITEIPKCNYLAANDSSKLFAEICELLLEDNSESGFKKIHPTACIHQTAKIGNNARIGPYVVIDKDVVIGNNVTITSHVFIGPKSSLGDNCMIHSNVVIREDCKLGNNVILQPSSVIGSCGFGYHTCKKSGDHTKIKQLGKVILEDNVEVGASTTIDRGRFNHTIVKEGTKIDNQCMIGHNCEIGKNNLIISMSGISGSVKTGENVIIAAQCGLVGHIEIADNVDLAARSAPSKSITKPGGVYLGAPAQDIKKEISEIVAIRKLPKMIEKFKEAEKFLFAMNDKK